MEPEAPQETQEPSTGATDKNEKKPLPQAQTQQSLKTTADVEDIENADIINVEASALPNRFKKYMPDRDRRLEIIEEGINIQRPIFADGSLGSLAHTLKPEDGYYDVVIHGYDYGFQYFDDDIDVETLCAIIAQRKDYKKGMKIRLISCNAGSKADGTAQYIANKLRVEVLAADKYAIVAKNAHGETTVYSGSKVGMRDGSFIRFIPED